jgi:hypothetical protein
MASRITPFDPEEDRQTRLAINLGNIRDMMKALEPALPPEDSIFPNHWLSLALRGLAPIAQRGERSSWTNP